MRLSVDERMWERYGRFTDLPSEKQRELTLATEADLREEAAELLRAGKDVVIDSCLCKRFKREAFKAVAEVCGAETECIYLTAPREELLARLARRRGNDANDIIVGEEDFERFEKNFEIPGEDEDFRTIDSLENKR